MRSSMRSARARWVVSFSFDLGCWRASVERLLTSLPITLDFDAWYVASSALVLLLVLGVAIVVFRLTVRRNGDAVAVG